MPIYEYTCQKCKTHIEIMQKVSDKPLTRHSNCGGKLEKEWSQTSFQLKGSGWYVTDYAGKKSEAKEGGEFKETKEAKSEAVSSDKSATASDKNSADKNSTATEKTKEKTTKASPSKSSTGKATGD